MGNTQFVKDLPLMPGKQPCMATTIYQSTTQYTEGEAATENCAAIVIPAQFFVTGSTFAVTMAGTKTGTNAAMSVQLSIGSTAVLTIAADDTTAVDWVAEMTLVSTGPASQKAFGTFLADTADPGVDYASASVNTQNEVILYVQMINGHASDDITCEYVRVDYWKY
jgi:hypothetical protein